MARTGLERQIKRLVLYNFQVISTKFGNSRLYLSKENPWAADIIDEAYLDEEILEKANLAPLAN